MQNLIKSRLVEAIFTITLKTKSLEKSGSLILPVVLTIWHYIIYLIDFGVPKMVILVFLLGVIRGGVISRIEECVRLGINSLVISSSLVSINNNQHPNNTLPTLCAAESSDHFWSNLLAAWRFNLSLPS